MTALERHLAGRVRALAVAVVERHAPGRALPEHDALDLADLTVDLLRGLGVATLLMDADGARRRRARLLAAWSAHLLPTTDPPLPTEDR